jgi:hypothetical protein
MLSKESLAWLQRHTAVYHSDESGLGELVENFDEVGKLGHTGSRRLMSSKRFIWGMSTRRDRRT